ncbi:shikimate kinase [Pseudalkalibacillus sp. SCS-8]|uniref:shikimate kinase n=1 Tax=Pseudalkalibacillus nanhaiensis TaxID=3115291 RepID=UPI0032DA7C14
MKTIYLTGFMGAGKTTIGKALAERMKVEVIDLDDYIEEKHNMDIPSIFQQKGESYFRDEEQQALEEVPKHDVIITTGGGAVLREANRAYMKEHGYIINLEADVETIYERISERDNRPLAKGKSKAEMAQLLEKRQPFYREGHLTVKTDDKPIDEIVEEIIQWIKQTEFDENE